MYFVKKIDLKRNRLIVVLFCLWSFGFYAQKNSININATLDSKKDILKISQQIVYHNSSKDTLKEIYLHNWANSFKGRETPLSNRFIEDFNRSFYFADKKKLGYSKVDFIKLNDSIINYSTVKNQQDIIKIDAIKPLLPNESLTFDLNYTVKIPSSEFTRYGKTNSGYNLRFWYITPAVYQNGWQLMSNLNTDDLYEEATDFSIEISLPDSLYLDTNLFKYKIENNGYKEYLSVGQGKTNALLYIDTIQKFKTFTTKDNLIITDIIEKEIDEKLATDILTREILFIKNFLGDYPHKQFFIDKTTQSKNPIYGLNKLPKFLDPFQSVFRWDLTMFKEISRKYIENTLLVNKRTDYWLIDGIQTYLMMKYVDEYYPDIKLFGKYSNYWGVRSFNIGKLSFNDKYPFLYRFSARQFLDQALTTRSDSLSNFNRKIINRYKAGLGLRYLAGFVGEDILHKSIKEYFIETQLESTTSNSFKEILSTKTTKDIDWFFGDYINTNKKIDYTIKKSIIREDSIDVVIKNRRNITAPVLLYGLRKDTIVFKKWINGIDSTKTVSIEKENFDRLILNYEQLYPEYNYLNNSSDVSGKLLNKPLKFTFYKDIESPNYNQIFYTPTINYNFYDGVIFGVDLSNKPIFQKNFEMKVAPAYAFKSKSVVGSFSLIYNQFFENSKLYNIAYGLAGSTNHYEPDLSYNTFTPFVKIDFSRETLRDVGSQSIVAKMVNIDKEVPIGIEKSPEDKYHVFGLSYSYSNPALIRGISYNIGGEYATNFSKLNAEFRYRKLTATNRELQFRVFAGAFLHNNSGSDYFSFGLDRANDYLFGLNYFGRSEDSGIFSQQFISAEGGFKSVLSTRFANEFMLSGNSSVGIWRWLEIYNDAAILKNKGDNPFFAYENGIRLNFVRDIFEFYLPVYSNNGFEIAQPEYHTKIRFVITTNFSRIYNFIRRGFF